MKTPEEIYLIPSTDADYDCVWCDDPAPTDSHDASEAVRYVRGDVVAEIERERDQLRELAIQICNALGNDDDIPLSKYALRYGRLANQLHQKAQDQQQ